MTSHFDFTFRCPLNASKSAEIPNYLVTKALHVAHFKDLVTSSAQSQHTLPIRPAAKHDDRPAVPSDLRDFNKAKDRFLRQKIRQLAGLLSNGDKFGAIMIYKSLRECDDITNPLTPTLLWMSWTLSLYDETLANEHLTECDIIMFRMDSQYDITCTEFQVMRWVLLMERVRRQDVRRIGLPTNRTVDAIRVSDHLPSWKRKAPRGKVPEPTEVYGLEVKNLFWQLFNLDPVATQNLHDASPVNEADLKATIWHMKLQNTLFTHALELHKADLAHELAKYPNLSREKALMSLSKIENNPFGKIIESWRSLKSVHEAITATEKPLCFVMEHATGPSSKKRQVGHAEVEEDNSLRERTPGASEERIVRPNMSKRIKLRKAEAICLPATGHKSTTARIEPELYDWQFFKRQEQRMRDFLKKGDREGAISIYEALLLIKDPYMPKIILLRMSWLLSVAQGLPSISFLSEIRRLASIVQVEGCVLDDHYRDTVSEILGETNDYWKRAKPLDTQQHMESSHESAGERGPATTKPDPVATTTSCENDIRVFYQRQMHRIERFLRQDSRSSANAVYKGIALLADPQEPTCLLKWMNMNIMLYEMRDGRVERADPFRFKEHQRLGTKMEINKCTWSALDAIGCWRHLRRVEEELFGVTELTDYYFRRPTDMDLEPGNAALCPKVETADGGTAQTNKTKKDPRPVVFRPRTNEVPKPREFTLVSRVNDEGHRHLDLFWGQFTTNKAPQMQSANANTAAASNTKLLDNSLAPEDGADKGLNLPAVEE